MNGIGLHYEIHGGGPPLVLIAGLGSDSQSWLPVIPSLAVHFTVIVYDPRGVGRTTPAGAEITIPVLADDCAALIEELGYAKAHLLGHSMGGVVAQACAARHPEGLDRLVLVGTASILSARNRTLLRDMAAQLEVGIDPRIWLRNLFAWILTRRFFDDEASVEEAIRYALEYPYPQAPAQFRRQVEASVQFEGVDPDRIRCETLVLTGAEDILLPPDEGRRLAEHLPHGRFAVIPGAAHSIHMEAPGALVETVVEFLDTR